MSLLYKSSAPSRAIIIDHDTIEKNRAFYGQVLWAQNNYRRTCERNGTRYEDISAHMLDLYLNAKTCYYCDGPLSDLDITFDHVIPISRGGGHVLGNVVVACKCCNREKASMTRPEFLGRAFERVRRITG